MISRDWILTILVVVAWGTNFTVTKIGIGNVPPMLLAAMRFVFVAFPAVFFIKRPKIEWKYFVGYALAVGVGQYSCLYYAIHIGMPAGLTSVVIQSSSFFTILLATMIFRERLHVGQLIGLVIAVAGLILIGLTSASSGNKGIPLNGLLLTVMAAFFWSISTIIIKKASNKAEADGEKLNMFGMVAWSAFIPPIPMLLMALTMDTPKTLVDSVLNFNVTAIFSILFLAWCSTLFGAGVWNYLLSKYDAGRVAPLSLLVPAVGLLIARIVLAEQLTSLQWIGSAVVIIGLLIFNLSGRSWSGEVVL